MSGGFGMRDVGETLRRRREEMGLDLNQVEQMTKIRKRYLMAIEQGDWSSLPGEVYGRGFVRSYAEVLGLDGLELLRGADERQTGAPSSSNAGLRGEGAKPSTNAVRVSAPGDAHEDESARHFEADNPPVHSTRTRRGGARKRNVSLPSGSGQAAIVVAILVVLGAGWWYFSQAHGHSGHDSNQSNMNASSTNRAIASNGNTTGNKVGHAQGTHSHPTPVKPVKPSVQITTEPYQNGVQKYVVQTADPLRVEIDAMKSRCWTQVTADGKVVDASDMIETGQKRTWQAKSSMEIVVGAAYAVQLHINGKSVTLPPINGKVNVEITKTNTAG
ncbi:MAG: DUF4115 domain-containing protein [Alicyclobacillus herbarius]|nr:DUF4115 domain-containing protein [Alicyclobacillus herbarius]